MSGRLHDGGHLPSTLRVFFCLFFCDNEDYNIRYCNNVVSGPPVSKYACKQLFKGSNLFLPLAVQGEQQDMAPSSQFLCLPQ